MKRESVLLCTIFELRWPARDTFAVRGCNRTAGNLCLIFVLELQNNSVKGMISLKEPHAHQPSPSCIQYLSSSRTGWLRVVAVPSGAFWLANPECPRWFRTPCAWICRTCGYCPSPPSAEENTPCGASWIRLPLNPCGVTSHPREWGRGRSRGGLGRLWCRARRLPAM